MSDDRFYSDGTVKVERFTLLKDGFRPLKIRKILGDWEMLAYTSRIGDERWVGINLSEDQILEQIKAYGSEE